MGKIIKYTASEDDYIVECINLGMKPDKIIAQKCLQHPTMFKGREETPLSLHIYRIRSKIKNELNNPIETAKLKEKTIISDKTTDISVYKNIDVLLTSILEQKTNSEDNEALYEFISNNVNDKNLRIHSSEQMSVLYNKYRDKKGYKEQAMVNEINKNSVKIHKRTNLTEQKISGIKSGNTYSKLNDFIVISQVIKNDVYNLIDADEFRKLLISFKLRPNEIRKFIRTNNLGFKYEDLFPIQPSVLVYKNHPTSKKDVTSIEEVVNDIKHFYHFDYDYDLSDWKQTISTHIPLTVKEKPIHDLKNLNPSLFDDEPSLDEEQFTEFVKNNSKETFLSSINDIDKLYCSQYNITRTWNSKIRIQMDNIIRSIYPDLIQNKRQNVTKDGKTYTCVYYTLPQEIKQSKDELFNTTLDDCIIEKLMDMKFNTINDAMRFKARLLNIMADFM